MGSMTMNYGYLDERADAYAPDAPDESGLSIAVGVVAEAIRSTVLVGGTLMFLWISSVTPAPAAVTQAPPGDNARLVAFVAVLVLAIAHLMVWRRLRTVAGSAGAGRGDPPRVRGH